MELKGKRLLVLGGSAASWDLIRLAQGMGVITLVTDDNPQSICRQIADEQALVSTTDIGGLAALVAERKVDGVFCGPSEFNIQNMIRLCEYAGLRCYATSEQWAKCGNKDIFKHYCEEYGVDCPHEYILKEQMTEAELDAIDFPIIVKPVDGCSSKGISVCRDRGEVPAAYRRAMDASVGKRIIAEKYIENGGALFGVRYFIRDGEAYPYMTLDTYVVDPSDPRGLISGCTHAPSVYTDYYMEHMDKNVRRMLRGMGLKNGLAFFQALPCNRKIYFHEMGFRLSGGMLFKLLEPAMGINDMGSMIRYALGGEICTDEELERIDLDFHGKTAAQLTVPLVPGTIGEVVGLDEVRAIPCVLDVLEIYHEGETVDKAVVGTLGQHFARVTMLADSEREILDAIHRVHEVLIVRDTEGRRMNVKLFDTDRMVPCHRGGATL